MEGISKISYQKKTVYVVDFTNHGQSKETTQELLKAMVDEFTRNPLNSILGLINVTHIFFHFDTLKAFKNSREKCDPYEKKIAVVGLKGLMKTGFNSVAGSSKGKVKAFDSEAEAKEWLVSD